MKKMFIKNLICFLCLLFAIDNALFLCLAYSEANGHRSCISPSLNIKHSDLKAAFIGVDLSLLVEKSIEQEVPLTVFNSGIIFKGKEISLFELTKSLNLLLSNKRFSHFARIEKDKVKYEALSKVEELLADLKNSELAQFADQIDIIIAILHLPPQVAAIALSGIDPLQQKSITNLTDKGWTNEFRLKRYSIATKNAPDIYNAWYSKALQTFGKERQWWMSMARRSMPVKIFHDLSKNLDKSNQLFLNRSI